MSKACTSHYSLNDSNSSSQLTFSKEENNNVNVLYIISLSLHRIARRWNQTGQKYAGADDISHTILLGQPLLLWILVVVTYLWTFNHIRRASSSRSFIMVIGVCGMAFLFKISFTLQDAPELLSPSFLRAASFLARVSLISQARLVFLGLVLTYAFNFYYQKARASKASFRSG